MNNWDAGKWYFFSWDIKTNQPLCRCLILPFRTSLKVTLKGSRPRLCFAMVTLLCTLRLHSSSPGWRPQSSEPSHPTLSMSRSVKQWHWDPFMRTFSHAMIVCCSHRQRSMLWEWRKSWCDTTGQHFVSCASIFRCCWFCFVVVEVSLKMDTERG